uniref:Ubiquinol-cytochrome c reductase complex assembly factor 6 n=3 Tax=Colobinae TaxID=9569 RepID=A0A2K6KUC6_RHIBE
MPAGVPMSTYLKMFTASLLAMFAGAEVVHRYYRPDLMRNRLRRVKLISQSHIA